MVDLGGLWVEDRAREALVGRQVDRWARDLIRLDHRNNLINFKPGRKAALDLAEADSEPLIRMLDGTRVSVGALFPDQETRRTASASATQLHKIVTRFREEQGVDVCRLACGLVSVSAGRNPSR